MPPPAVAAQLAALVCDEIASRSRTTEIPRRLLEPQQVLASCATRLEAAREVVEAKSAGVVASRSVAVVRMIVVAADAGSWRLRRRC